MPRPRWERLGEEKRAAILHAAASEFASKGFKDASFNQIIEAAGLSKGAMYYYFDDKEDLFLTVMGGVQDHLLEQVGELGPVHDAESYWRAVRELFERGGRLKLAHPQVIDLALVLIKALATGDARVGYYTLFDRATAWMEDVISRGQEVEAVRRDCPAGLLVSMVWAVYQAMDVWMVRHLPLGDAAAFDAMDFAGIVDFTVTLTRRLLEPGDQPPLLATLGLAPVEDALD